MTILFANNASTTISGSITAASTTVQLASGTGIEFPAPSGGNYFVATFYDQATKTIDEIVHVTNVTGDVATMVRAQEGTVARAWNAGDIFANLVTAGTLNNFVQAGTGPANTSMVYVGTDVGAVNGIVATSNPVPSNFAVGMLFNILIGHTNTGPTTIQINGTGPYWAVRTDGSMLVANNVVAGEEMMFIWNGSTFTTTVPPIPQAPPQTTFYVSPGGSDSNSGFSPDTGNAFASVQGAINAIKQRYISQNTITIKVADGTYYSGWQDSTNYIAAWSIVGNSTYPQNCVINAQSTNSASFVSGAPAGRGAGAGGSCVMTVQGFTFYSYYEQCFVTGGTLGIYNCNFTLPVSGGAPIVAEGSGGSISVAGNISYNGLGAAASALFATGGGLISIGWNDIYGSNYTGITLINCAFTGGVISASAGGQVNLYGYGSVAWGGAAYGPQFICSTAAGIVQIRGGNVNAIPANQAGIITPPGWLA